MDIVVEKIMKILKKNGYADNEQYEIVQFGVELLLMKMIIYTIIAFIGIVTRSIFELFVFLLIYQPLRSYCGGYHAQSRKVCVILSTLMMVIVIVLAKIQLPDIIALYYMATVLFSGIVILLTAPVDTPNKPFDDTEKVVFRKRSMAVLVIDVLISIFMYYFRLHECLSILSLAMLSVSILLLIGKYQKKKVRYD